MDLLQLQKLYSKGVNIIEHLEQKGLSRSESLAISYDLQAGSYIKYAEENPTYTDKYAGEIADIINGLPANAESIMEVGVGEATTLTNVRSHLTFSPDSIGFDISLSRILFARNYFDLNGKGNARFFVGDMFNIPYPDSSVDIVYTSHTIEPNRGREKEALTELYRVTGKYLVLFEPSYEFADAEGKERMNRLGYITGLLDVAKKLGMKVVDYRLTKECDNSLNPTAVLIIEKNKNAQSCRHVDYCCPQTLQNLNMNPDGYWSESALKIYPVILDVPCLTSEHGIVAAHYSKFI